MVTFYGAPGCQCVFATTNHEAFLTGFAHSK